MTTNNIEIIHILHLRSAYQAAVNSLDPSTKVGSILADGEQKLCEGWNQFPRGIEVTLRRMNDREFKLRNIVHAEMSVITQCALSGIATLGTTLYTVATDDSGDIWGGPPCTANCCKHVIAAGIKRVVSLPKKLSWSKWHDDLLLSHQMLEEAKVEYVEVDGFL